MNATDKQMARKRRPKRGAGGKFVSGGGGGPGRPKGTPNHLTAEVKAVIYEAFERKGGVKYLVGLDDAVFCRLLALLIPRAQEHTGEDGGPMQITVNVTKHYDADAGAAEDGQAPEAARRGS